MKKLLIVLSGLMLAGCTHSLHVSHLSDFSPTFATYQKGEMVEAASEQFVIMGFVTQTDYVDQAYEELKSRCFQGQIQGIETQFSTDHGFFSWTNRVHMQGLCLKKG